MTATVSPHMAGRAPLPQGPVITAGPPAYSTKRLCANLNADIRVTRLRIARIPLAAHQTATTSCFSNPSCTIRISFAGNSRARAKQDAVGELPEDDDGPREEAALPVALGDTAPPARAPPDLASRDES